MDIFITRFLPVRAALLRKKVFMDEQGFSFEFDQTDSIAFHLMICEKGKCIAVCRMFSTDNPKQWHIGRVAVESSRRKTHLGKLLMESAERFLQSRKASVVIADAQCRARRFYEKCGFDAFGPTFLDEHCPHISMRKNISQPETDGAELEF